MSLRLPLFALLLLLTACNRHSDAQLQAKLSGTWTNSIDQLKTKSTVTVGPTGAFDCQVIAFGRSDGITRTSTLSGTWMVRNGLLIDTTTRHSNTNAPLPMILTSSIIRLDAHELVIKYPSDDGKAMPTNEFVLRREGK